jgi:hypothetical protein
MEDAQIEAEMEEILKYLKSSDKGSKQLQDEIKYQTPQLDRTEKALDETFGFMG